MKKLLKWGALGFVAWWLLGRRKKVVVSVPTLAGEQARAVQQVAKIMVDQKIQAEIRPGEHMGKPAVIVVPTVADPTFVASLLPASVGIFPIVIM